MDITNIPQNLIKALEQKTSDQLVALSRVLNLALGKNVVATVTSTAPVTPAEREALLKQTAASLSQLNKNAETKLTPALKAEISRLLEQQNLIKSPDLKWVNLQVNNRPLLVYSDRPLVAGQTIPLQLQTPQKLVTMNFPAVDLAKASLLLAANTGKPTGEATATQQTQLITSLPLSASTALDTVKNTALLNELLKTALANLSVKSENVGTDQTVKLNNLIEIAKSALSVASPTQDIITKGSTPISSTNLPNQLTATLEANAKSLDSVKTASLSTNELSLKYSASGPNGKKLEAVSIKNIIGENLRNLLPNKDAPNVLLSAINQLQQMPTANRLQLIPPNVEQALKSLAEKIRAPEQLAQPKTLVQVIKNSGVFFENTLHKTIQNNAAAPAEGSTNKYTTSVNNAFTQDLKGSLLKLLSQVTQEMSTDKKPLETEQILKLLQPINSPTLFGSSLTSNLNPTSIKSDIAQAIALFMQQLMHKPVKELSNKELRTQLLVLLQQQTIHSLAKIQLQQLHSLNHEVDTKDSTAPNASWQVDIPVKQHNDVHHLHVRIDREWIEEKNEPEQNKKNGKTKQWSVTLRFDLPSLGEFCAQLIIVDTQVRATLWAAQEKTFGQVSKHLEGLRKQLEDEGIDVKSLQCARGMPPEKPMALSYSLIDIST